MQSMKIKEKTSPQLLTYYGFSLHPYCPHCQQYHMTKIVKSSLVGLDKVLSFGVCEVTFFFSPQCICTVQLGPVYPGENRWLRRTGESMLQLWPKVIAAAQRLNEMGWHHGSESADCLISPNFPVAPHALRPFRHSRLEHVVRSVRVTWDCVAAALYVLLLSWDFLINNLLFYIVMFY